RAVNCGLLRMQDSAKQLPSSENVVSCLDSFLKTVTKGSDYSDVSVGFPAYLTELEKNSLVIHKAIQETWFQPA
ncbi:MAG: hypothetical protein KKF24_00245, partial [Gammaproteobacteria bacterium]|nr:hypothetical protein [Gammaproteobacteria bacterium]MBU1831102.1 hypothetical protein [Gammaproteobacteria bacterium]